VCAFKLPVDVKTKEQLKSLINAVIEMQGQRVAFMRFADSEELFLYRWSIDFNVD
jgi:hypothetical protein